MQERQEPAPDPEARFARNVRKLRETAGMAQTALAEKLAEHGIKVDGTAITRLERGSRMIRLNEAVAIAAVFRRPIDDLLKPMPDIIDEIRQLQDVIRHLEEAHYRSRERLHVLNLRLNELRRKAFEDEPLITSDELERLSDKTSEKRGRDGSSDDQEDSDRG